MGHEKQEMMLDVVALRDVLGSLDTAHGELVYATLYVRYVQTGLFGQVDLGKARKYRKLCFCFFKMTGQMLPLLADYTCVLLAGLASKEMAENSSHTCYDEAERLIWRLSTRHIGKGRTTPLADRLNRTYARQVPVRDVEERKKEIMSVVRETACLVDTRDYRLAIGNLTVLFRVLHKLYVWHPELFALAGQDEGRGLSSILTKTRTLFCTMRAVDGLPNDIAEEMDCVAVVKNARYNNFFGAWDSVTFMEMLNLQMHRSRCTNSEKTIV